VASSWVPPLRSNRLKAACALTIAVSGCDPAVARLKDLNCDQWTTTFFREPMPKQMSDFARFPVDTQYAIYLCGNQIIHPPAMHLGTPFAAEGGAVVPFLKQKLSQARDDITIRDIVRVFTQMQVQKTYDVIGDRELITLMNSSIAKMRDPGWRQVTQNMIDRMSK
jgi:hypothetical protein